MQWTSGSRPKTQKPSSILDRFIEAGGNLVDTANVYGGGDSEELLGRWFAGRPSRCHRPRGPGDAKPASARGLTSTKVGSSRRNLDRALTASLRRLGRDKIDLYQLHGWDPLTPIEETLRFLDDAVRAGKISYIGLSNFTGWQMQLTISTAEALGLQAPVTLQPQYSLVCREIEYEIIPAALHNQIGLLPWSPLASGFLTGKYKQGEQGRQRQPRRVRWPDVRPDHGQVHVQEAELGDARRCARDCQGVGGDSESGCSRVG